MGKKLVEIVFGPTWTCWNAEKLTFSAFAGHHCDRAAQITGEKSRLRVLYHF